MQTNNQNDFVSQIETDIRAPDPVVREQLINEQDNYNNNYTNVYNNEFTNYNIPFTPNNVAPEDQEDQDAEFNRILQESKAEFEFLEEQKVKELIAIERNELTEKYRKIKQRLQKIQSYDTVNTETYNTIVTIIEMYEMQYVDTYSLDENSYANIFNLIKTIRLTKEEYDLLNALIVC